MRYTSSLKVGFEAVLNLIFPNLCACCIEQSPVPNNIFCLYCENSFGYCQFDSLVINPLMNRWIGRVPVAGGLALVYFREGNNVQSLLHRLKYEQQKNIGFEMGRRLGSLIRELEPKVMWPEIIIPVPLHPKREYQRGYNQSYIIATGVAEVLKVAILQKGLTRSKNTLSQTRKNKMERMENVRDAFEWRSPGYLSGKRVLLIDDVFTSGATLEACVTSILKTCNPATITLACLAMAET